MTLLKLWWSGLASMHGRFAATQITSTTAPLAQLAQIAQGDHITSLEGKTNPTIPIHERSAFLLKKALLFVSFGEGLTSDSETSESHKLFSA